MLRDSCLNRSTSIVSFVRSATYLIFFLSGAASQIYEVAGVRSLNRVFGGSVSRRNELSTIRYSPVLWASNEDAAADEVHAREPTGCEGAPSDHRVPDVVFLLDLGEQDRDILSPRRIGLDRAASLVLLTRTASREGVTLISTAPRRAMITYVRDEYDGPG